MPARKTKFTRKKSHAEGEGHLQLHPIGRIRSGIKKRSEAPKQGSEGAPDAWLEVSPFAAQALDGIAVGHQIILIGGVERVPQAVSQYPAAAARWHRGSRGRQSRTGTRSSGV